MTVLLLHIVHITVGKTYSMKRKVLNKIHKCAIHFHCAVPTSVYGRGCRGSVDLQTILVMISVRPKGVAVDEDITPSFRFQYAAHVYDPEVSISRPILAYTVEQICFSETTAKKYLDPKKKDFLKVKIIILVHSFLQCITRMDIRTLTALQCLMQSFLMKTKQILGKWYSKISV